MDEQAIRREEDVQYRINGGVIHRSDDAYVVFQLEMPWLLWRLPRLGQLRRLFRLVLLWRMLWGMLRHVLRMPWLLWLLRMLWVLRRSRAPGL